MKHTTTGETIKSQKSQKHNFEKSQKSSSLTTPTTFIVKEMDF